MYELEVDHATYAADTIPSTVRRELAGGDREIHALSLASWEEHCTECAAPECYRTCDLYEPRKDGKCRRFEHGIGYVEQVPGILGYAVRIAFRRWGVLQATFPARTIPARRALPLMRIITATDRMVARLPDRGLSVLGRRGISSRLMRRAKRGLINFRWPGDGNEPPDAFCAEIHNPSAETVPLSLVIRDQGELRERPYQQLLQLAPGFNRIEIPYQEIASHIQPDRAVAVSFCPNLLEPEQEGLTLDFGYLGFIERTVESVQEKEYLPAEPPQGQRHVKVVAWDLDRTVWDGILVEDGEERLALRPGVAETIRELDRRGIVNSVVSKNDHEMVMPILERLGLSDYFVFPKIGWNPKSESVRQLIESFNVGADTVAVVDDSPFERHEIGERCPGVRVYTEDECAGLPYRPEFRPPLSASSSKRRKFYRAEELRARQLDGYSGDYDQFLRECSIEARVYRVDQQNLDRAHELIQRTNQLNFSGNRYSREQVDDLMSRERLLPLLVSCRDRFGDYGVVGFCLFDTAEYTVRDLTFSCRVQAKKVEHGFLSQLAQWAYEREATHLDAVYVRTARNGPAGRVFDDLGFELSERDEAGNRHLYRLDLSDGPPAHDVVRVHWEVE